MLFWFLSMGVDLAMRGFLCFLRVLCEEKKIDLKLLWTCYTQLEMSFCSRLSSDSRHWWLASSLSCGCLWKQKCIPRSFACLEVVHILRRYLNAFFWVRVNSQWPVNLALQLHAQKVKPQGHGALVSVYEHLSHSSCDFSSPVNQVVYCWKIIWI